MATPDAPDADLIPSLMAASDVLGTGWYAAWAANAGPARQSRSSASAPVGLMAVLAATQLGAEQIIISSRHDDRQELARPFGATDIVEDRGDDVIAEVKDRAGGHGAHGTIEAVGTRGAMDQAIGATRPGGHVGFLGVSHNLAVDGDTLFGSGVALHGGPAPVRRFLPQLNQLVWDGTITRYRHRPLPPR